MPTAIAEAIKMEKGKDFEWMIEDKNTLVLTRCNKLMLRKAAEESNSSGSILSKKSAWVMRLPGTLGNNFPEV